jgi:uncharacterized membrane protein YdjX (TVP38/TMEM64 family)
MGELISRYRWALVAAGTLGMLVAMAWWVWSQPDLLDYVVRLYKDKKLLKRTLHEWGVLAPVLFMALQAMQVVISPIPGEATGFLGGFLFGQWLGLLYSTIGLGLGSTLAFVIGRWLGARFVRSLVKEETWNKLGFIVEAEGAILCFIIYLIPGLPKDVVCYLFGMSPMPLWVFALVSTLGRIPGTWVLSAQGDIAAAGQYVKAVLLMTLAVAVALPLYYYRHRIVDRLRGRPGGGDASS